MPASIALFEVGGVEVGGEEPDDRVCRSPRRLRSTTTTVGVSDTPYRAASAACVVGAAVETDERQRLDRSRPGGTSHGRAMAPRATSAPRTARERALAVRTVVRGRRRGGSEPCRARSRRRRRRDPSPSGRLDAMRRALRADGAAPRMRRRPRARMLESASAACGARGIRGAARPARRLRCRPSPHGQPLPRRAGSPSRRANPRSRCGRREHIRALLAALYPACDGRPARPDDAGRPDPRPAARRHRRQGPVHQGARSRDGRGPRRSRRAFAEGRADGHAARASRSRRSPRARIRATRSSRTTISTSARTAGRRARRHVEPAARGAAARARSAARRSSRCAATSTRGCASSTKGSYDAIILAAAGLKRLGFGARIASLLDPDESLPAVGQGALALECRADRPDVIAALAPLADRDTTLATTAERAFSRALSGSCHTPLAAHAVVRHGELWLRGLLASRDGGEVMRGERERGGRRRGRGRCAGPRARRRFPRARRGAARRRR